MLERASMPAPARTVPEVASDCRVCGKALPADTSVCPACGAAHGEESRCPHCRVVADVEPHTALGFRCLVCGGPRLPPGAALGRPSQTTQQALAAAGREQTKHLMLTAAGLLLAGMGALALLVATLAALSPIGPALVKVGVMAAASVPGVAAFVALRFAATARRRRAESLHAARLSALADAQAVTGPLDAARAASLLRIEPERAELLLAEVSVAALLQPGPPGPEPRLRVEPPAATVLAEDDAAPNTEKQRARTEV